MTALADVQRALNAIRSITSEEQAAVRLEVLRLMATMIADEARDIEGVKVKTAQPKRSKQLPTLPIPKSANTPKPTQAALNSASIAARLRTHTSHQAHSTQVVLTSENDVRVLCSGGVERVCACCMG